MTALVIIASTPVQDTPPSIQEIISTKCKNMVQYIQLCEENFMFKIEWFHMYNCFCAGKG